MTNFADTLVTCQRCGKEFIFTVTDQRDLAEKGLSVTPPEYCPSCGQLMPLTDAEGKAQGVVKWFNSQKGYGFITMHNGDEIFVHKTGLANAVRFLNEGQLVEFEVEESIKGPQAVNVAPVKELS